MKLNLRLISWQNTSMWKYSFRYVLTLLAFLNILGASAQTIESTTLLGVKTLREPASALVIKSDQYLGELVSISLNGKNAEIPLDPDSPDFRYFYSSQEDIFQIEWQGLPVNVIFIRSGSSPSLSTNYQSKRTNDCDFDFQSIDQSEWREGLATPSYTRIFTSVNHSIIHHSAGSNANTNYTQVVRDIYLFHTQVNGWSDIGYNYLIAQNGVIYKGRDPDGGAQDDVRGAHFCGSNSGTMGVCLLGNYETATPSMEALEALNQVLSFKTQKESFDPFGTSNHDTGILPHIAGHRDGCSTLCPGENIYRILNEIRFSISEKMDECLPMNDSLGFTVSTRNPLVNEFVTFENQSFGYDSYTWNLEGGSTPQVNWLAGGVTSYFEIGQFDVQLIGTKGELKDTLLVENYIDVTSDIVFPTLVSRNNQSIKLPEGSISDVSLISSSGRRVAMTQLDNNVIPSPQLRNGLYFLQYVLNGRIQINRILIQK